MIPRSRGTGFFLPLEAGGKAGCCTFAPCGMLECFCVDPEGKLSIARSLCAGNVHLSKERIHLFN